MSDKVSEFDSDYLKRNAQKTEKTKANSIFSIWCFIIYNYFNIDLYVYTFK